MNTITTGDVITIHINNLPITSLGQHSGSVVKKLGFSAGNQPGSRPEHRKMG